MEKFLALPQERQDIIAAAAMSVFGAVGYKKAYISDIAAAAGISKALVFHYFGSKKTLYLYLIEYTGKIMAASVQEQRNTESADFFEKIVEAAKLKLSIMNRYPAMAGFLASIYYEDDPAVASEIQELLSKGEDVRMQIALSGTDESKFKDGVDPKLVINILVKFTEGVMGSRLDNLVSIDAIMLEFSQCVDLLRNNLYKEEFLK
ncbi:MAG: TetR/AcrR family transcriptional regulator [Clostridiales bacterium]|nr:TetR/AcrR family transcriptional regulator [Clostridiales bacterium]